MRRLFLRRYGRELLAGASAGALASLAALTQGDALGALGPVFGGPWLHFHPQAVLPAALPAGVILALGGRRPATAGWVLVCLALGGLINGLLEIGSAPLGTYFQAGGGASLLAFGCLGLPALGLAWGLLALALGPWLRPHTCTH